ncbi:MAG: Pls/PosA family non-ribosomal peptide synthetase [Brevibacterium aurantiacum]|uniref:Amino acid adenylation domain-containing protein n=1 Tax=Brevibacterium aurantiacum TaxID=273384 RepID=A0A1D7W4U4_BREAU|nr:Pls/PosA family non-ribosomal peptide synthetase [Brevibacterium aurantiacum]MDN5593847.1 amino acid adenylation domain-containing protein [Brevibacterium sp.]AOP54077.1 non-ribosomal peptide synthetase, terminal component [Brevibacterium aurantiacum]AZL09720.1 amino acid adenylation protein [Brevibacterium aurantiacum]AZL13357.1 amino acid adenylation protein [Brevibacterium aurantiacum]AZT93872.1 amino acid adenylation protein [Brevibacterium aurantiacum]
MTVYSAQFPAPPRPREDRTLIDVLLEVAGAHGDQPAIDDGQKVLSYSELIVEIRDLALQLAAVGIGPGDKVGVRVPSGSVDLYVSILATMMLGAAYVPVDVDDPDERAHTVFTEAAVTGIITADRSIEARTDRPPLQNSDLRRPTPDDDCWVIFTSGSTGKPKGVAVSHRSAAAFVDAEAAMFCQEEPLGPGDRVLAGLSVAFDASCEEMWLAWRHGACLVPAPRTLVKSGMDLGPWLSSRNITVVSTVPTLAALWPADSLDAVRLLIFGGEACPPELGRRLSDESREVWNTYGPTEATVVACGAQLDGSDPVRIGLPLAGWSLAVVDAAGIPVAEGETGELIIGGIGLARYLDPEKDAEKYAPMPTLGWDRAYRSGDLVVNDPAGLVFVGRADEQIKLAGRRIELGEIDAALQALPGVEGAAAAVKQTPAGTDILVGYLASSTPDPESRMSEWEQLLRAELPAALVPRLTLIEELPTKTSGKVDRNALPWPMGDAAEAEGSSEVFDPEVEWIAEQWSSVLGARPGSDTDFFTAGGGSLAAAQLVSRLRTQHPSVTVGDIYSHPRFGALSTLCLVDNGAAAASARPRRTIARTSKGMQAFQTLLAIPVHILGGVRWVVIAMVLANIGSSLGADLPVTPWPVIITLFLVFVTAWGRMLISAGAARALMAGIRPGDYPRSGWVHKRLWLAEHIADLAAAVSVASAPWVTWYAKLLGNKIGSDADLHSAPPVTGFLTLGDGAAIEPEVDLKGWWVDGDLLRIGTIEVGSNVTIGARSTLMPGTRIGEGALVEAGSAVTGKVRRNQIYSGSPAVRIGKAKKSWPAPPPRRRLPFLLYALGSQLNAALPYLAALPGIALMLGVSGIDVVESPWLVLAWSPLIACLWFVCTALFILVSVRLLSIGMEEGEFPVRSARGYRVWATERLLDLARDLLFPLYASMLTPWWLRLLGAKVGPGTEISTVVFVPKMTTIAAGAFLADDTMVASYELGHGWMRAGRAKVGKRAFLGNSGIASPGRRVPKNALVAVLSAAPAKAKKGSSWLGSPPVQLRRAAVDADEALTYAPNFGVKAARGFFETLRITSVMVAGLLIAAVLLTIEFLLGLPNSGSAAGVDGAAGGAAGGGGSFLASVGLALLTSGIVMMAAGAVAAGLAIAAKWICAGPIKAGEHPLWSSFIWRNEVADCFVELIAAPWFARNAVGTPAIVWYLRAMGAKIGHGVWCETYWLPEADLVSLGDNSTINRGCVVQTHLFHDRVMSLDTVELEDGSTLGPNSVILPASSLGTNATVGATSLVMRGEFVPAHAYFSGNPVIPWVDAPELPEVGSSEPETPARRHHDA